jgi:DHA1 family bicyclomycin/chloramphenicol resistance-like MFS transporter
MGAMLSASVETLILCRLFQGLAASLALVVAMSKIRDVADGVQAAWLFAILVTIEGLAPVLAPFFGGIIDTHLGWRAIMAAFAIMGFAALANSFFNLSETLPKEKRIPLNLSSVFGNYARIISDIRFLFPALSVAMAFFFLFAYAGGAAYVYQNNFGLNSDAFGIVFGLTGLAVLFGAMASAKFVARFGTWFLSIAGAAMILIGAFIAILSAFSSHGFFGIAIGMFVSMFGLGIAEANMVAIAMSSQKTALGSTAALVGSLKLMMAALSTPFAAWFAEKGTFAWLVFLVLAALSTVGFAVAGLLWSRSEADSDSAAEDEGMAGELT